jgi:hypothetical protein
MDEQVSNNMLVEKGAVSVLSLFVNHVEVVKIWGRLTYLREPQYR